MSRVTGRPRDEPSNCITINERTGENRNGPPRTGYILNIGLNVDDWLGNPEEIYLENFGLEMALITPVNTVATTRKPHYVARTPGNRPYISISKDEFESLQIETGQFFAFRTVNGVLF